MRWSREEGAFILLRNYKKWKAPAGRIVFQSRRKEGEGSWQVYQLFLEPLMR